MARFNRVYRLPVGQARQVGIEIARPIRITFDIEKTANEQPNPYKIQAFNLAPSTIAALTKHDAKVLLYACYQYEDGALLMAAGCIVSAYTYMDGPDLTTELEVRDGYFEIRDTAVSLGYGPGASSKSIVSAIASQMGLPLIMADDVPARSWAHGFSFFGPARVALHKITQGTGLEWSIQNQALQIIAKRGTTPRQAIVL